MPALTRAARARTGAALEPPQDFPGARRRSRAGPSAPPAPPAAPAPPAPPAPAAPAAANRRRPRRDVPPTAGHKHERDDEGSAGPERKRRRVVGPGQTPQRPAVNTGPQPPGPPGVTRRPSPGSPPHDAAPARPPTAAIKRARDDEGAGGPEQKRRRVFARKQVAQQPAVNTPPSVTSRPAPGTPPHDAPAERPTIDALLASVYPHGRPGGARAPHDSYHDPYTGRRRSGWVRPQLRDPFSPGSPPILGVPPPPRRSRDDGPLAAPSGISWLSRRLAFSPMTPPTPVAAPATPGRATPTTPPPGPDNWPSSYATSDLVLGDPTFFPLPRGSSSPPPPAYLHGRDPATGAELWTRRSPDAAAAPWADHFPDRDIRREVPRPDPDPRRRVRTSPQYTQGGRSAYRRRLADARPIGATAALPVGRVAVTARTHNRFRWFGAAARDPADDPPPPPTESSIDPADYGCGASDLAVPEVPSRVERRWGVGVDGEGEIVYPVGRDARGQRRWKALPRYTPGTTERAYGVPPDGRLRVRAPDVKGLGEIFVGWNMWGAEDWRPIWLRGYAGPYEEEGRAAEPEPVGPVDEREGLRVRGLAEGERRAAGDVLPDGDGEDDWGFVSYWGSDTEEDDMP